MMNLVETQADHPQDIASLKSAVSYWSNRAHKAEQDLQFYKQQYYLQRDIRRAPVIRPIAKDILEECLHTEKWGTVKAPDGSTRANYTTIAERLHCAPDTVSREAERLEKLGLIKIHEHQGPKDERDRKYIQIVHEQIPTLPHLKDTEGVVPKQGGNRYICPKCDSTNVSIKKVTWLHCDDCHHEEIVEDTGWIMQIGHKKQKTQKQLAFQKSKHTLAQTDAEGEPQKQLAEHSVYTLSLDVEVETVPPPEELRSLDIWACWRYEPKKDEQGNPIPDAKPNKVPYNAKPARAPQRAKSNDPKTWASYDQALATYEESKRWKQPYNGIELMCNGDFTVIDYDHCIVEGKIDELVMERILATDSYAEVSPSGTGIHQIAFGTIARGVKRPEIEMYCTGRPLTWTGNHLVGTSAKVEDRQEQLPALFEEIAPPAPVIQETKQAQQCVYAPSRRSDEQILDMARNPKKGDGAKFRRLYDDGNIDGYPSQSEADLALCRMLAYWSDGDEVAIDRLFRQSALYREKWDRSAGSGTTYGERTITQALATRRAA